jgi:hypothetical protein
MAQTIFYPIPSTHDSSFHWVEDSFEGSFEDTLFSDFSEILQDINDEILCDNNKRNLSFDYQLETEASTSRKQTSGDTPTDFEDILQKLDEEAGYNKSLFTFNTSIGSISLDLEDKITHSSRHDDSDMRSKNLHSITAGVAITNPPKKRKLQGRRRPNSLPCDVVDYLKEWLMSPEHINHPYPSESEKARMVADTGIQMKRLNNWFVNNRIRFWKPRFEAMHKKNEQQKKRKLTDSKEAHTATACKNNTKKNTQQKKRKLIDSKEAHAATA